MVDQVDEKCTSVRSLRQVLDQSRLCVDIELFRKWIANKVLNELASELAAERQDHLLRGLRLE